MSSFYNRTKLSFARLLRKDMTKEERRLWYNFLRTYPEKFKRQKIIGNYIVDFYCPKAKLAIELDGSQHFYKHNEEYDKQRTKFLKTFGIHVLRIQNYEILTNFAGICEYIDRLVISLI